MRIPLLYLKIRNGLEQYESKDFLEEEKRGLKGKSSEIRRQSELFLLFHQFDWPIEMARAHERRSTGEKGIDA